MKSKTFSYVLVEIGIKHSNKADAYGRFKNNRIWGKWVVVACLSFLIIGAFSFMQSSYNSKSKAPTVLANNTQYTICGKVAEEMILKKCGLPTELSAELAGPFFAYLEYDGECYYTITEKETDKVMFEYKAEPNTDVYIVLIENTYYAAIRRDGDGFHGLNGNSYKPDI